MSEKTNSELSSMANAFPGNTNSVPDFVEDDELFADRLRDLPGRLPGERVHRASPSPSSSCASFDEQFQMTLDGDQSVDDMLAEDAGRLDG